MTEDNVTTVRAVFAALNRQDLDAVLALHADDVTIDLSASMAPGGTVLHGSAEAARWWRNWLESWDTWSWEVERVTGVPPDAAVSATRVRGRGRGSGIEVDARGAQLWRFAGGRVSYWKLFQSEAEALAAAGAGDEAEDAG